MKITILAGGTGSIALQTGLYELLDKNIEGIDTKIVVNAYDCGLSTGAVRKVLNGNILGPSDVRKNQTTRLKLEQPLSPWHNFLDTRFTIETPKAKQFCLDKISDLEKSLDKNLFLLKEAVEEYFSVTVANKIDYTDFSLANIIYAGFAKANGNSLRAAAKIMAKLMGIKDNVILNDDKSLFLGAITKSGIRVTDEGDIVSWGNKEDPFVNVFFTDAEGKSYHPVLCEEAKTAIIEADLIILSSGTQWSSLIPTYASIGFKEAIAKTSAKILMVMNRQPDKDSPGQTASDIIDIIVPRYFSKKTIHLITDSSGHSQMCSLTNEAQDKLASWSNLNMQSEYDVSPTKHDPLNLAHAIGYSYFGKNILECSSFIFDYDDTLVGRGNVYAKASAFNTATLNELNHKLNIAVCSGNSIKAINLRNTKVSPRWSGDMVVYADGGVNKYSYNTRPLDDSDDGQHFTLVKCVDENMIMNSKNDPSLVDKLISLLADSGIAMSKIENRGNVMIAIRPIDPEYRRIVLNLIKHEIGSAFDNITLDIKEAGRSTIEISKQGLSKVAAINDIINSFGTPVVYIGDELDCGNDECVKQMASANANIKCLKVTTPVHTAFFLKILAITKSYID